MHIENGTTVEVELEDGKTRTAYVGKANRVSSTHKGTITFIDRAGKSHDFEARDDAHKHFLRLGPSELPLLTGNGGIGFPDSLEDATVFVLSRGKVIAYDSYKGYLNCLQPAV